MNSIINTSKTLTKNPDLNDFHMHTHDFYEIYLFLSGNAKYFVEGNIYKLKPGDIFFIKKSEAHSLLITSTAPYERAVIQFTVGAAVSDRTRDILSFFDSFALGKGNRFPFSMFKDKLWAYYIDKIISSESVDTKSLYLSVLINEMYECLSDILTINTEQDGFSDIIAYLNNHLADHLTLDGICSKFYISKSQLNRKFKHMTGSTVWEYIITKRLLSAKELLKNGEPPTKVYTKCGFNDYTSFFRAYKTKFSVSPKNDCIKSLKISNRGRKSFPNCVERTSSSL
ncbi:MAG: AraC family transcriptional regulator [Firmicutes bacterium]|nr:AraC family transcriptional regulator [Bacillota bacterium]